MEITYEVCYVDSFGSHKELYYDREDAFKFFDKVVSEGVWSDIASIYIDEIAVQGYDYGEIERIAYWERDQL